MSIDLFPDFRDRFKLREQYSSYRQYASKIEAYQPYDRKLHPLFIRAEAIVEVAKIILSKNETSSTLEEIIPRLVAHLYKRPVFQGTRDALIHVLQMKLQTQKIRESTPSLKVAPSERVHLGAKRILSNEEETPQDSARTQGESVNSSGSVTLMSISSSSQGSLPESPSFNRGSPVSTPSDAEGEMFVAPIEAISRSQGLLRKSSYPQYTTVGASIYLGLLPYLSSHCKWMLEDSTNTVISEKKPSPKESISQPQNQPTTELLKFFEGIAVGNQFSLPDGAVCEKKGNVLTILLPQIFSFGVDVKKPLDLEEFNQFHTPYGKVCQTGGKKIGDLTCFGTIGPRVWEQIRNGFSFHERIVIRRDGNTFTFVSGGPSGITSLQFNGDKTMTISAKLGRLMPTMSQTYNEEDLLKLIALLERQNIS